MSSRHLAAPWIFLAACAPSVRAHSPAPVRIAPRPRASAAATATREAPRWFVDVISTRGGFRVAVALDGHDVPHVLFSTGDELRLARGAPETSAARVVHDSSEASFALVATGENEDRIAWLRESGDEQGLGYESVAGDAAPRDITRVDTTPVEGRPGVALELDPSGHPHACYTATRGTELRHAYWDGSAWHTEPIASAGSWCSLRFDHEGRAHVAYEAPLEGHSVQVVVASHDGTAWHVRRVATEAARPVLALDAGGHEHVAFLTSNETVAINYARAESDTWHIERVETYVPPIAGSYDRGFDMRLDANGRPHLVHLSPGRGIGYATFVDGRWISGAIADATDAKSVALALDHDNRPYVAYSEQRTSTVRLARPMAPGDEVVVPHDPMSRFALRECARMDLQSREQWSYARNCGRARDDEEARQLLERRCASDDAAACFSLAGVRDLVPLAFHAELIALPCRSGHTCLGSTSDSVADGDHHPPDNDAAIEHPLEVACNLGHADACQVLAGRRAGRNRDEADALRVRACRAGRAAACVLSLRADGSGDAAIPDAAARAFRAGCDRGDPIACNNLGVLTELGIGVQRDVRAAGALYRRACGDRPAAEEDEEREAGDEGTYSVGGCRNAMYFLARHAAEGRRAHIVLRDVVPVLAEACNEEHAGEACMDLSGLYSRGLGTRRDPDRARELRENACEFGVQRACATAGRR